jgi:3-hydroxyacyl-[acyl-carrier-protein] dehydratase
MTEQNDRFIEILEAIPHQAPFRFIDRILFASDTSIAGEYTFREDEFFYRGHFPGNPITPGVILTECMAQIGLVAFGMWLEQITKDQMDSIKVFFTHNEVKFLKMVLPGTTVRVEAEKDYFRFRRLQCKVKMLDSEGACVALGTISGMFVHSEA